MNNFKNFQAKQNLKIVSFNNPKILQSTGSDSLESVFFTSNFIIPTNKRITLPTYDQYMSRLNIKPNDIIVYTILFTKQSGPCVQVCSASYNVSDILDHETFGLSQCLEKTINSQCVVVKFFDTYYKIY